MRSKNKIIISAAGSGKTTYIVRDAIARKNSKVAILTYTNNNLAEIRQAFYLECGCIPDNVKLYSWYQFILRECARPYQGAIYREKRIESIFFPEKKIIGYAKKCDIARYYFAKESHLIADHASDFVIRCNTESGGLVIDRLSALFDHIYIDEVQDLAGYDFDLLECFLASKIAITLVGDTRQATYSTNRSAKNSKFKGNNAVGLFQKWEKEERCTIEDRAWSYRCPQMLCDLADALYPAMPKTKSLNEVVTGHDGIFLVPSSMVLEYVDEYQPTILRYNRTETCLGLPAFNFGDSKGKTFGRVLIFPNGPLKQLIRTGDPKVITAPDKYYVAFTRAKHSLAFVYDGDFSLSGVTKYSRIESPSSIEESTAISLP